ncbi:PH domain-containing protein [Nocardioides silvaticus]|nr:PH domain-containing protein [Nocardioides silvaticus]
MSDGQWLRLDPRMLLVHPIDEIRKYVVPLLAAAVFGATQGGNPLFALAAVGIPLGLGVVRYLTTSYRIADGRVELRRGLLNRQLLSTPIDRVRTIDLESTPIHRLVGLTTMTIGTGGGGLSDNLKLDGLEAGDAQQLRSLLLADSAVAAEETEDDAGATLPGLPPPAAAYEHRWLRFAPFTSTGIVIFGGVVGGGTQFLGEIDIDADAIAEDLAAQATVVVLAAVVALGLIVLALTVLGYLVTNWEFTLQRHPDTWHVSRGLLTTRETTLDVDRLAGVSVSEPPGLRLARGARLSAIVTGLDKGQSGSAVLVPPAPDAVVRRAAAGVLGTDRPVSGPLEKHGRAAVRRRWARALLPAAVPAIYLVAAVVAGAPAPLLVLPVLLLAGAAALAADRVRSLGHAVVDGYLVTRSGSLLRHRDALASGHVIGWTTTDTWFQRRAGLTTLAATTAGGQGKVEALDLPAERAVEVAHDLTPELVGQFLASPTR